MFPNSKINKSIKIMKKYFKDNKDKVDKIWSMQAKGEKIFPRSFSKKPVLQMRNLSYLPKDEKLNKVLDKNYGTFVENRGYTTKETREKYDFKLFISRRRK
mmetsp:Transcript_15924/g.13906  ORF Transcript_15924/g.13906 Transcript_15924/m.13906 type:complete len:101 (+) Transcript_15924:760-1062(+)